MTPEDQARAVYVCCRNSDLTEGKGREEIFAIAFDLEAALATVRGASTQGTDGSFRLAAAAPGAKVIRMEPMRDMPLLYGYHQDAAGNWMHGWTDDRHLTTDPEFSEYLRLAAKFERAKR